MIYLATLFLVLLFAIYPVNACIRNSCSRIGKIYIGIFCFLFSIFIYFTYVLSKNVQEANKLNAEIQFMPPHEINEEKYNLAVKEYASINNIIQQVIDKYQPQVIIKDIAKGGLFNYTVGGSADSSFEGLGDIEKGTGEKLANLNKLVDKKHEMAKELITLKGEVYQLRFNEANRRLYVLKNSFFDGLVVSFFVKEEIKPVPNKKLLSNGVKERLSPSVIQVNK